MYLSPSCTGIALGQDFILDVYGFSGINVQRFGLNSTLQCIDVYAEQK